MRVLVRGLGNIGTTLANLLLRYREPLGIAEVLVHSARSQPFFQPDRDFLRARGAQVLAGPLDTAQVLARADYLFDCRAPGAPRADMPAYERAAHLVGACAQGTEAGFGVPFVTGVTTGVNTGVGHRAALGARFVQVASCNTHALASLLQALAGANLDTLQSADFVIARRAEDIGNHERLVSGAVVARHRDADGGTHHADEVRRVFAARGANVALTTSSVTTPSQFLHAVRFNVRLSGSLTHDAIAAALDSADWLARTDKFDSNRIFELGRRYGFQGRIYAHAIVVASNLQICASAGDTEVRGWAFVPQEGNTLLSTLHAFMVQTRHPDERALVDQLRKDLLLPRW